jgi:hypothetical protein
VTQPSVWPLAVTPLCASSQGTERRGLCSRQPGESCCNFRQGPAPPEQQADERFPSAIAEMLDHLRIVRNPTTLSFPWVPGDEQSATVNHEMKLWPAARPVISCEPRTEPPGRVLKVGSCGGAAFGRYLVRQCHFVILCVTGVKDAATA